MKLSKAFDDVHTSKSDPDIPFPSHHTYTPVYNTQQVDERTTDQSKQRNQEPRNITKDAMGHKENPLPSQSPLSIQFSGWHLKCSLWEPIQEQGYYHNFFNPTSARGSDYLVSKIPLPHLIWAMERNNYKPRNRLVRMHYKNDYHVLAL